MLFLLSNPRDIPVDDLVSEEDVVVVTLSYRVNAFGFFSYEDPLMPGNLQLLYDTLLRDTKKVKNNFNNRTSFNEIK